MEAPVLLENLTTEKKELEKNTGVQKVGQVKRQDQSWRLEASSYRREQQTFCPKAEESQGQRDGLGKIWTPGEAWFPPLTTLCQPRGGGLAPNPRRRGIAAAPGAASFLFSWSHAGSERPRAENSPRG